MAGQSHQPNLSYTMSLSSSDCKYVTPAGAYVFDVFNSNLKNAVKVSLATLELPLSQFPVEQQCSRIYFQEGLRLGPGEHEISLTESSGAVQHTCTVRLPLYRNVLAALNISEVAADGSLQLECSTQQPHCLWATVGVDDPPADPVGANLARLWVWGDTVRLVDTPIGDVAFDPVALQYIDASTFRVSGARATGLVGNMVGAGSKLGALHAPHIAGSLFLAFVLENAFPYTGLKQNMQFGVNTHSGALVGMSSTVARPPGSTACVQVAFGGDGLARKVGVLGSSNQWRIDEGDLNPIRRCPPAGAVHRLGQTPDGLRLSTLGGRPEFSVAGSAMVKTVMCGQLPSGWYDLSTRPLSRSTHRFVNSWFNAMHPLLLFPPNNIADQPPLLSPHLLRYHDSSGQMCTAQIILGNHTPTSLAIVLAKMMSATTAAAPTKVSVVRHPTDTALVKFRFEAAPEAGSVVPSPPRFALLWGMSTMDAAALGFCTQTYSGSSVYISPKWVCAPHWHDGAGHEHAPAGLWTANVLAETRRLQFACDPLPYKVIISQIAPATANIVVHTGVVSQDGTVRPWVHGWSPGTLVQFRRWSPSEVANALKVAVIDEASSSVTWEHGVQVHPSSAGTECLPGSPGAFSTYVDTVPQPDMLSLPTTCMTALLGQGVWTLEPARDVYPSLFLNRDIYPHCISPETLGLTSKIPLTQGEAAFDNIGTLDKTQLCFSYGTVGDVALSASSAPPLQLPFSAWSIYRFDPPEILIIDLNDRHSKASALMQHVSGNDIKSVFARINLNAIFREGGLRAEVLNTSAEALTTLTLTLRNPDMTLYQTHNSNFTFALNIVTS